MFPFKLKMFPRRLVLNTFVDMAGNTTNEYRWVISRAWTLFGIRLLWKQQDAYLRFGFDLYNKKCWLRWVDWIYFDSTCVFQSEATTQNFIRDIIDNPSRYYAKSYCCSPWLLPPAAPPSPTSTLTKTPPNNLCSLSTSNFKDIL